MNAHFHTPQNYNMGTTEVHVESIKYVQVCLQANKLKFENAPKSLRGYICFTRFIDSYSTMSNSFCMLWAHPYFSQKSKISMLTMEKDRRELSENVLGFFFLIPYHQNKSKKEKKKILSIYLLDC
jgi:hypothetical protein